MKIERRVRFELASPPPSLNNSTMVVRGRKIKSNEARAWFENARLQLLTQRRELPFCYFSADILIPAHMTRADIDNLAKPIVDVIRNSGRIPDDRYCVDHRVRFYAGDRVLATFKTEDLDIWASIKKPSKSLRQRMEKSLLSTSRLL
jgi:Holliday junction resolvase RusA-like endonuclease